MTRTKITVHALGLALALATPAFAQTPTPAPAAQTPASDDSKLEERIDTRLDTDATLKRFDLDVAVEHGVATLTGTVLTAAQKTRATTLAKVAGITDVVNNVEVDPNWKPAPEKTKDAVNKAADKTGAAVGTAAEKTKSGVAKAIDKTKAATKTAANKTKEATGTAADKTKEGTATAADKTKDATKTGAKETKEAVSKTGEVITDAWITGKVKASFAGEDLLKGSDINVDTNDRVVTLKGTVATAAGRTKALDLAKGIEGVSRVVDQIVVK